MHHGNERIMRSVVMNDKIIKKGSLGVKGEPFKSEGLDECY